MEAYYRELCKANIENFHLVEGTVEFFDILKANKTLFSTASASIQANIDFFVESFHLDQWFCPERIIYDDGSFANKVEMFCCASVAIGVPADGCMVFEDAESSIRDARMLRRLIVWAFRNVTPFDQKSGRSFGHLKI